MYLGRQSTGGTPQVSQQWGLSASGPDGGLCSAGIHSQMHIQTPICQQSLGSESLESHMLPQLSLPHLPSAPLNGPGSQGGLSPGTRAPFSLCGYAVVQKALVLALTLVLGLLMSAYSMQGADSARRRNPSHRWIC